MNGTLILDGLIAIEDPPRPGVKETIERAQHAGIRIIMVTGDHPQTAAAIAGEVGIPHARVLEGKDLDALADTDLRTALDRRLGVCPGHTPA